MRAICKYVECMKTTTNNQDIRLSVAVKALFTSILWTTGQICTIKLVLENAHPTIFNNI